MTPLEWTNYKQTPAHNNKVLELRNKQTIQPGNKVGNPVGVEKQQTNSRSQQQTVEVEKQQTATPDYSTDSGPGNSILPSSNEGELDYNETKSAIGNNYTSTIGPTTFSGGKESCSSATREVSGD